MTFEAQPVEGATYRVNRKNLGSGGSDTLFTITVTAADGETKTVYQVTVHRSEKEEAYVSQNAKLLSLTPATGTLSPAFDPDRLTYTLTVPFEVTTMTFDAQPVKGATYRVNRKNLGSGGSDTLFASHCYGGRWGDENRVSSHSPPQRKDLFHSHYWRYHRRREWPIYVWISFRFNRQSG